MSHQSSFLQGVFKTYTHYTKHKRTKRIKIWTVYIKTKVQVTPIIAAKWNILLDPCVPHSWGGLGDHGRKKWTKLLLEINVV